MKFVFGLICIMLARAFAAAYRAMGSEPAGRHAVRLCCAAFFEGATLDRTAADVVKEMGPEGIRLLKLELRNPGRQRAASEMLKMIQPENKGRR